MHPFSLNNLNDLIEDYIISSTTDLKGNITYATQRFCDLSGYTKEELIGKPHNIIRHPNMLSSTFKEMWNTIQAGNTWKGEIENRKKDGSSYFVDSIISPLIKDGQRIGYMSLRFDITGYKELELKAQEAEALSNAVTACLMDKSFDQNEFLKQKEDRGQKSVDNINYHEPILWMD